MRSDHDAVTAGGSVSHYLWLVPSVCCTLISSAIVVNVVIDSNHNMIYDLFMTLLIFFMFQWNTPTICHFSVTYRTDLHYLSRDFFIFFLHNQRPNPSIMSQ